MTILALIAATLTLNSTPALPITPTKLLQPIPPAITATVTEADNPSNCNTDTQWVASEAPHYCIDKQTPATAPIYASQTYSVSYSNDGNGYSPGWCTWHVKNRRPDLPNNLGNAYSWTYMAQADGLATGYEPRAGAAAQLGNHVVYVEEVYADGSWLTSEMNYQALWVVSQRVIPPNAGWSFIYY